MSSIIEKTKLRMALGQPVLEQFFKMTDKEIKLKVKSILKNKVDSYDDSFVEFGSVKRVIQNEQPQEIIISYYDSVEISFMGIYWKPEHGGATIVTHFDEHFVL